LIDAAIKFIKVERNLAIDLICKRPEFTNSNLTLYENEDKERLERIINILKK
jgi:hypothetical protein